ncbi:glycosyltransferase, putative [Indibacter alkaliphilus LW1]|uniref:Glycosyltransferase, putative n=1 Tax=Indibacter alkaliphilus (strain CCUG 57479 / KCTC 22604 / LW1) TaxID=1189612 RepID=S2DAX4_INDAL|nr:glycosyltransferase family 4 protein [Indibacter alkaliphilus]EOZ96372.1 glycosyltransferase, putative [Indibacter alkaliphilus LW1]
MTNKKILFVTNMYPFDKKPYFGIFIKEQIDELKKSFSFDHEVYFINGLYKSKLEYLRSILRVPQVIRKFKPDIIHVHYGISGLFLLFYKPKIPVIMTLHGCDFLDHGDNWLQVMISKAVARKVDKVLVQNRQMVEVSRTINPNVQILTCGVDTEFFQPDSPVSNVKNNEITIVFPSDPSRNEKNYPLFKATIEELEKSFNKNVSIVCIHNMDRSEIRNVLSASDCLIMTSISEGSPQVVKEALSCGLPVISVDVGNVKEMLEGIPACFCSEHHDPKELAHLANKAIEQGRNEIRSSFLSKGIYDNKIIAHNLWQIYNFNTK